MRIESKNIILTGASSGIGLEVLKLLMKYENSRIVAVARHIETIPTIDNRVFAYKADIGNPKEIDLLFEFALETLGSIDIFIANAGFAYMEKLSVPDWEHNEKIFSVNTLSPIYALEKLSALNSSSSQQYFVCISSAVSQVALPYYSLYCSTKSAIHHFLETYRYECRKSLQIACVYPVATKTVFFEKATKEKNPIIPFISQDAATVAKSIVRGIEKDKKRIYPSALFYIFSYIGRVFPFIFTLYSKREKYKIDQSQQQKSHIKW